MKGNRKFNAKVVIAITIVAVVLFGVTALFQTEGDLKQGKVIKTGGIPVSSFVVKAKSYTEISEKIKEYNKEQMSGHDFSFGFGGGEKKATMEGATTDVAKVETANSGSSDFSGTNVQVEGIEEGDIVKTDGSYIYSLVYNKIYIAKAEDGQLSSVSVIDLQDTANCMEMYVLENKIVTIEQNYINNYDENSTNKMVSMGSDETVIRTYDITDRANPNFVGEVRQEGCYNQSRFKDGFLYVFTDVYKNIYTYGDNTLSLDNKEPRTFVPTINGEPISPSDIFIPETINGTNYTLMSGLNLENPVDFAITQAVQGGNSRIYVTDENIYLEFTNYKEGFQQSNILKLSYEKGNMNTVAAGCIKGSTTDDFAYDEYNGYLRVVTTAWSSSGADNNVYILDGQLNVAGQIEGLAKGEEIKSARFMGDTGYFVTFRNIDPLFSVDLADPSNPKIMGELKITGFSEYLHFYGENKLLGIGLEIDPETQQQQGLKLSMFDITDPYHVTEVHKVVLANVYGSSALYNYKSVLINKEKNIIGFNTGKTVNGEVLQEEPYYQVFGYEDEKGFVHYGDMNATKETLLHPGDGGYESVRGLYIGKYLYIVNGNTIASYDMHNSYQKVALLTQ